MPINNSYWALHLGINAVFNDKKNDTKTNYQYKRLGVKTMIKIKELVKIYNNGKANEFEALKEFHLKYRW